MRSAREVERVLALAANGLNDCAISRVTSLPRTTVRDWRRGQLPVSAGRLALVPPHHAPPDYAYLLGLYLGDGHISRHPRGVFRLRISLDQRYPKIITLCKLAMGAVLPHNLVGETTRQGCVDANVYAKCLPALFPQHGPGPKHERPIMLERWQRDITRRHSHQLLRGLIHSDGARYLNTVRSKGRTYRYARYEFTNASKDIRALFCEHCDLAGIEWRRMNERSISVARREAVAFVGPKE